MCTTESTDTVAQAVKAVLTGDLAELDEQIAEHRKLITVAREFGFDQLADEIEAGLSEVREFRDAVVATIEQECA